MSRHLYLLPPSPYYLYPLRGNPENVMDVYMPHIPYAVCNVHTSVNFDVDIMYKKNRTSIFILFCLKNQMFLKLEILSFKTYPCTVMFSILRS